VQIFGSSAITPGPASIRSRVRLTAVGPSNSRVDPTEKFSLHPAFAHAWIIDYVHRSCVCGNRLADQHSVAKFACSIDYICLAIYFRARSESIRLRSLVSEAQESLVTTNADKYYDSSSDGYFIFGFLHCLRIDRTKLYRAVKSNNPKADFRPLCAHITSYLVRELRSGLLAAIGQVLRNTKPIQRP